MEIISVGLDKQNIKRFVDLPKKLYSKKDNMESASQMKSLLKKTHPLSKYFTLDAYLILKEEETVGRFAITTYENDTNAYLGFFECINDKEVSSFLFTEAEKISVLYSTCDLTLEVPEKFGIKFSEEILNSPSECVYPTPIESAGKMTPSWRSAKRTSAP